jgi:hypothetical protein
MVDKVPNDPEDESQGAKETITGSKINLPCALHFAKIDHTVPQCMAPEQVGLGLPVANAAEESK